MANTHPSELIGLYERMVSRRHQQHRHDKKVKRTKMTKNGGGGGGGGGGAPPGKRHCCAGVDTASPLALMLRGCCAAADTATTAASLRASVQFHLVRSEFIVRHQLPADFDFR